MKQRSTQKCIQVTIPIFFYFFVLSSLSGQIYRVPLDPPKVYYRIDASINLKKGLIEGKERIEWVNSTSEPMEMVALDWSLSERYTMEVKAGRKSLVLLNETRNGFAASPLFFQLPDPLYPEQRMQLDIAFSQSFEFSDEQMEFGTTKWYPRLWWDGLPVHDAFSVRLDIPEDFALAISGFLNQATGRYEIDGAKTFGIYLGRGQKSISQETAGVHITTLSTDKGTACAAVCMKTAMDAIQYYKDWLGFYPFEFLYIIPGGSGRWGGYPFATGIVVIHGMETFEESELPVHWQRITAHEIGHEYWGEWILDPDNPDWLWIGMGIFADTEYILNRNIDPGRRQGWMSNYLEGLSMYANTTVDIPPNIESFIEYDRNNVVIHSKGYSIISALDVVLGRETFDTIYTKCLNIYGGKRFGWREFQRFCEQETGQNLGWFFDAWVRSNDYLCYAIQSMESIKQKGGFLSTVMVRQLGTMSMPVPVKAVFKDGSHQIHHTSRGREVSTLSFRSTSGLKDLVLNSENRLAMLEKPLPEISEEAVRLLAWGWDAEDSERIYAAIREQNIPYSPIWYRLGMYLYEGDFFAEAFDCFRHVAELHKEGDTRFAAVCWQGLLKDLMNERTDALKYYQEAIQHDTSEFMSHSWLRITMNRQWVEERLKIPFTQETSVNIPAEPTVEELKDILNDLNWKREGETPLLIYEKANNLDIGDMHFWLKLGMLLFDSGYYPESFTAFTHVPELTSSNLYQFTGYTWMGHLKDLLNQRQEALVYYQKALKYESGDSMQHSQFRMRIDRQWVEKRLRTPFTWKRRQS